MPMDLCAQIQRSFDQRYTSHARHSLDELPDSFTITDPHIPGHPIVFASPGFLKLTGYARCEVLGQTAAIFQGPGTSRRSVMEIREAVREERTEQVVLLNYRKDGTPFWMLFRVCPVFSADGGAVVHFVAVQVPLHKKDGSGVRDFGFGCCRKEVCTDSLSELGRVCSVEQVLERDVIDAELEREDPCVASDEEMRSAATAMDNIFSVLTHFSEATGRFVCRKRCSIPDIKESIKAEQPCTVRILNYRKDESSFWNFLHISPVRDASGKVAYFVGVQIEDSNKNDDRQCLSPEKRQLSVVGVVKVAVRSLSMSAGSSKS